MSELINVVIPYLLLKILKPLDLNSIVSMRPPAYN